MHLDWPRKRRRSVPKCRALRSRGAATPKYGVGTDLKLCNLLCICHCVRNSTNTYLHTYLDDARSRVYGSGGVQHFPIPNSPPSNFSLLPSGKGLKGPCFSTTRAPGGLVPAGGAVQNPHLRLSRRVLHHQSFLGAFLFRGSSSICFVSCARFVPTYS